MIVPLFHFRGYVTKDPLDKAPFWMRLLMLVAVNLLLTLSLLYVSEANGNVQLNGFQIMGVNFSPLVTKALAVVINCFIFSPLLIRLRKASSLYLYLLVFIPYLFVDLFIEHHYRAVGQSGLALWNYGHSSLLSGINPPALRFFVTLSVVAFFIGVAGLFFARLLAGMIYRNKQYLSHPTKSEYQNLFKKEWTDEPVDKPERGAGFWTLRILGLGYFAYLVVLLLGLLGPSSLPDAMRNLIDMTYANPALAINTYFKIGLMIMLTFIAAYNRALRFYACLGLLVGHLLSTIYSLVFYFADSLKSPEENIHNFLLVSAIVDGVMIAIFLWILLKSRVERHDYQPENDFPTHFSTPLGLQNRLFQILAIVFVGITATVLLARLFSTGESGMGAVFGYPDPMVGNTVTLYGTLAFYYSLLIKRRRLRAHLFHPVVVPLLFGSLIALLWVVIGDIRGDVFIRTRSGGKTTVYWYFILFALFNLLVSFLLIASRKLVFKIDYAINALNPSGAAAVMALSNAFFEADHQQQAAVLKGLDQYCGGIRGRRRGLLNLPFSLFENVLNFAYGFRPSFSSMSRDEQRYFIKRYFLRDEPNRKKAMLPYLADFAYNIGTSLNTLITFAFYSTIRARNMIGYVPLDARDRVQGDEVQYAPPHKGIAPLPMDHLDPHNFKKASPLKTVAPRVTTPYTEAVVPEVVDFLIIGSGAAGATMAYRLAKERGQTNRILVVERGHRYQPLQDFSDSEIDMIKKIYKEGGLQQTKRLTMTVLQGECVGGTTISNNAVCFRMPDAVYKTWQNDYGIPLDGLGREYERIGVELSIHRLGMGGVNQKTRTVFERGVNGYNETLPSSERLVVDGPLFVNHLHTVGSGNWNLGNQRLLKRSMLETYLPWAEANGASIVSNLTALRFLTNGNKRKVAEVILRTDNGELMKVAVKKAVVVAGGVISSSHFLMRSEVSNPAVGQGMSCNFALPLAFGFKDPLKAYDGDQITMAAIDPYNRAIFETYFNPPASFTLASMPFFFGRRKNWMDAYVNLANFGSLVGSEPNGNVRRKADVLSGQAFDWHFGPTDLTNIRYALSTLLHLGMHAGSTSAILPTKPGLEIPLTKADVSAFTEALNRYPLRMDDLYTGTAHPQGGNLMACKNAPRPRVIDENFRVLGYENLYVTDASVFPTSLTVNPQWTIMAMSSMASREILTAHP